MSIFRGEWKSLIFFYNDCNRMFSIMRSWPVVDIKSFQCPNCGANLEYEKGDDHILECEFCDSTVIVPSLKEDGGRIEQDTPMEKMQELAQMVADNQKVDAVNLYQEIFGVNPGKASAAVNKMFKGESVQIISGEALGGIGMPELNKLAEIGKMIGTGRKIEAIKLYREAYGVGLREAKETVEKMMRGGRAGDDFFKLFTNIYPSFSSN